MAECAPSGWLALELDSVTADPARLDDAALVDAVVALDRVSSWALARQARLLAEFARRRPPEHDPAAARCARPSMASEFAPDEIGLTLRLSRTAASTRLHHAIRLDRELSATRTAWESGRTDVAKVRAICDATATVPPATATVVQDRVLGRAGQQTVSQLRASLARAVIAADPAGAEDRHRLARHHRRVVLTPEADGMASLWALLPAPAAVAGYQRLTQLARQQPAGDCRGMDARRADLLVDLLTGRFDAGAGAALPGKPLVQVTVPLTTLTGATEFPGELSGYGPIPATLAREIAADGVWRRLATDPLSGTLLDHGRSTYRPPAALADFVRARDLHCGYPTCRQPATTADLDHIVPYADGGSTSAANLHPPCRHHHRLKGEAPGWTVSGDGNTTVTWTTPTGHSSTNHPHDYTEPTTDTDPDPPPF